MKILGCDCSTKLIGCVMIENDQFFNSVLISNEKDMNERIKDLYWLSKDLLTTWDPDVVYVEQAIYCQNIKTTLGIDAVINAVRFNCLEKTIPCMLIDNKSWKKDILGNGKASKEQIMEFALAKWGDRITVQDEADAACIALFGVRRIV